MMYFWFRALKRRFINGNSHKFYKPLIMLRNMTKIFSKGQKLHMDFQGHPGLFLISVHIQKCKQERDS